MKHSLKIVSVLIVMFLISQLIGIAVNNFYSPQIKEEIVNGTSQSVKVYSLPYGMNPPAAASTSNVFSIIIAIVLALAIMLLVMKFKAEIFLRWWFFVVILFALSVTLNVVFHFFSYSSIIALIAAIPLAIWKVFKRNMIVHNLTELIIYPGISAVFVPLLNIWAIIILLVIISVYDMYAVWKAGFMQKMAKYQMEKVKVFAGFFIPYLSKDQRALIAKMKKSKQKINYKKIKISVAALGGGDVVYPIITTGVVLQQFGLISAIIVALCATLALTGLLISSKHGKFYPAMPFISAGLFLGIALSYLINIL